MVKISKAGKSKQLGVVIPALKEVLDGLRNYVDNINKAPQLIFANGVYKQRDKGAVQKTSWNGWEFGYQIIEHKGYLLRKCFMKCKGLWDELPKKRKDEVTFTVLEAMMDEQQDLPVFIKITPNCMVIGQKFQVMYLYEKNPKLVSISNMPIKGNA